ncbi:MAG: efflux RND transporter periplasmic adaptor subunit [Chitinophagaceae bacterium]|nr:efflux RND transporter periplasmic adaptor subunit [Chitinophagaceae bacterium]
MFYKKYLTGAIAISGIVLLNACGSKSNQEKTTPVTPVPVTIAVPGGNVDGGIAVSGQVEAIQTANISTRMMGTITRIYVKVGDRVRKGQTLVSINSQDLTAKRAQTVAAISEAQANVNNAQKDYERFTNLYNKQSASAKELDNVTLQYNAAKARLEAATQMKNEVSAMMTYSNLTAPFDGVVTQRMADEGNMANPGMPLLTVEQNTQLQVSATVSESDISLLKKGQKAQVEVKAIGKSLECVVSEISPSSQFTGGQYQVKLNIPEKDKKELYAGMYVNVFIPVNRPEGKQENTNSILVPTASLIQNDQLTELYTISSNNTAILRLVRTGKTFGDKTEILSGLGQNEKFIEKAEGKLYNGVPVKERK